MRRQQEREQRRREQEEKRRIEEMERRRKEEEERRRAEEEKRRADREQVGGNRLGKTLKDLFLSTLIRIWINFDELLNLPFWYLTNGCGLWLTGVYTSTAGGGAEAPGDPATAAPPWTGHASGESHSTSFFPLLSFKKKSKWA